MENNRLTRNQYQFEINKKEALEAVEPKIQPITQQELLNEVKAYEKSMKDISLWPFIGLINWALENRAKNGDTELVTYLSKIINLADIRLGLDGNPIDTDTLHTVRSELIENYTQKYADYLAKRDLPDRPNSGWPRLAWELTHNHIIYQTKARDKCIDDWKKSMTKIQQDIEPIVIVHNAITKEYAKICKTNKIVYNQQLHIQDIKLAFDFSKVN
ncbi:hypothetical protein [Lactobacillus crispatus]|uniref:Uncharacterized protein n=2 Tax=Lactobacillus crispatus TaxID=47770 RepID=A0AAW8WRZ1_9LACO|nr:hypothetical protein [Lactobacillus crispatus]MCT7808088.1 hypothetical protein [Lactobacillus crispatus]MCT7816739.1 hypothetical protein [Lactobacillus crispatus]MCZ3786209.1 hypothetical protein [Lactobacillus crispatus]MCZ3793834.1 hypothetical protein [Lactobacillus crispatus]MDT9610543.1 hypothetical protein [Lactobacillus crispatus]